MHLWQICFPLLDLGSFVRKAPLLTVAYRYGKGHRVRAFPFRELLHSASWKTAMSDTHNCEEIIDLSFKELGEFYELLDKASGLIGSMEARIGVPNGFLFGLRNEKDDWAFIIKLSVVCEAAVTHALVLHVGLPQLFTHFSDMSQNGRLGLCKQLGLLDDQSRHTLGAIAFVRNQFAHRTENVTGSLGEFFQKCDQNSRIDLVSKLARLEKKPNKDANLDATASGFRDLLFVAAMSPFRHLANLQLQAQEREEDAKRWKEIAASSSLRTMFDDVPPQEVWGDLKKY